MVRFLITFLSVYGAVHLYLFLKARSALSPGVGLSLVMALFLLAMVVAPIAVRLLDRHGLPLASRYLAYISYTWMGLVFFFFWMSICLDVFNVSMRILALLPGSVASRFVWTGKNSFVLLTLGVVILGAWSALSAWQIRLERVALQTTKLPAGKSTLTIAQISDVHLGLMVGERRMSRIIRLLERAKPDVLVCSGDLVDAQMERFDNLAGMLAKIEAPLGKFAVMGNHEFYAGIGQSEKFLKAAGFMLLRNQEYSLDDLFRLVGMDDPVGRNRYKEEGGSSLSETALLARSNSQVFTVLLKHRPTVENESLGHFDLQLSGHTHGGQIFPFNLVVQHFYPKQNGLYQLDKGSRLYVSRGTGTWGPPMRFLSPPAVTLIEIKSQDNS
jgi:predicted MPP superfamily phosphohydrolase